MAKSYVDELVFLSELTLDLLKSFIYLSISKWVKIPNILEFTQISCGRLNNSFYYPILMYFLIRP